MPSERKREPGSAAPDVTDDAVLGGRLRLRQPRRGHRVGHDAILLAAACPARAGERVVDLGAGVGAAGLALAARIDGVIVTLVEVDPHLAALATENAQLNGLAARVASRARRRDGAGARLRSHWAGFRFGGACLDESAVQRSGAATGVARPSAPLGACRLGRRARRLDRNRGAAAAPARNSHHDLARGWPCRRPAGARSRLRRGHGAAGPSEAGEPAIRVLVQATKASRAPLMLLAGLVLNDRSGRPTAEAESVLREGATLPLAETYAQ